MKRSHLFALGAFILVTPALAQVMQVQPIQRPIEVQPIQVQPIQQENDFSVETMTLEQAKAMIGQLRREKRELDARLTQAIADIEQMTTRGGSLVRAYCESPTLSRNTAGGTENCGRYTCGDSSGLCKTSCSASPDCATGYSCDAGQCLTLGEVQARQN